MTCDCASPCERPHLTLEAWRKALGCLNPFTFWQWGSPALYECFGIDCGSCDTLVREHAWQGFLGRDDLRRMIARAEATYQEHIGQPLWTSQIRERIAPHVGSRYRKTLTLRTKHPIAQVGEITRTKIATSDRATSAFVLSAEHTCGITDTYTLSITLPAGHGIQPGEIEIYFSESDRGSAELSRRWLVDTELVRIVGDTLTVTGGSWLLAKPELYRAMAPLGAPHNAIMGSVALDPNEESNYVDTLDIYRRTIDPCKGHHLEHFDWCGVKKCRDRVDGRCGECTPIEVCQIGENTLRPDLSPCTCTPTGNYCVSYVTEGCGLDGQACHDWTYEVAVLAASYLKDCLCSCQGDCITRWSQDVAVKSAKNEKTATFESLNNPLGTTEGQIYAWKVIESARRYCGGSVAIL